MKIPGRSIRELTYDQKKRLVAWVLFGALICFGFWKVQNVANESSATSTESKITSQHAEAAANDARAAVAAVEQEAKDRAKAQCEAANISRQEIKNSFNDLLNLAVGNRQPNPDETDEERAQREAAIQMFLDQFNAKLDVGLPIVDCDKSSSK